MTGKVQSWSAVVSCQVACPIHTDVCGYVTAIADGNLERAYEIARANNPFVSICGRVCGAPCETACRRGRIDAPVAIRSLKRFVTERFGVEAGRFSVSRCAATRPERIAIIGAGVAGLSAAHDLCRWGYAVTVFEGRSEPGGMLTSGVPVFRLSRDLVAREIQSIVDLGVDVVTGRKLGTHMSLEDLRREGFSAMLLSMGLQTGRRLKVSGADLDGVWDALNFLEEFNRGIAPQVGERVIVIGGGNVAMDAARAARRLGRPSVTIVCAEQRHDMRAAEVEVEEALAEGIDVVASRFPLEIRNEGGRLSLRSARCLSLLDTSGRFAPRLDERDSQEMQATSIIFAVGQASDFAFLETEGIRIENGLIRSSAAGQTSVPDVFAAGDAGHGARLFVDAIAAGQRAARGIHSYLAGKTLPAEPSGYWRRSAFRMDDGLRIGRSDPLLVDSRLRVLSTDTVESDFTPAAAEAQANRCLRCNINTSFDTTICVACGACERICPQNLIHLWPENPSQPGYAGSIPPLEAGGAHLMMVKDESTCIRCGMCADACPTQAVTMQELIVAETERLGR